MPGARRAPQFLRIEWVSLRCGRLRSPPLCRRTGATRHNSLKVASGVTFFHNHGRPAQSHCPTCWSELYDEIALETGTRRLDSWQ